MVYFFNYCLLEIRFYLVTCCVQDLDIAACLTFLSGFSSLSWQAGFVSLYHYIRVHFSVCEDKGPSFLACTYAAGWQLVSLL